MATKGEIAKLKVSVDVDVNKASLAELQKSLKDIQNSFVESKNPNSKFLLLSTYFASTKQSNIQSQYLTILK